MAKEAAGAEPGRAGDAKPVLRASARPAHRVPDHPGVADSHTGCRVPSAARRLTWASRPDGVALELQGHGHTADSGRPMTIPALAGDVVALLDHLGIAEADLFGFSLGGLVAYAVALDAPARVGKLIAASADARRPPGRESTPPGEDRMPTPADYQAMRDAYAAVAPDPAYFDQFAARTSAMVHEFPGWTGELRSLQVPALLIFGDRDFSPLPDVAEMFGLLPDAPARRAPRDYARRRDAAAWRGTRVDHAVSRRPLAGLLPRRAPTRVGHATHSAGGKQVTDRRFCARSNFGPEVAGAPRTAGSGSSEAQLPDLELT